ncbi:MAG: hypothetical protein EOO47_00020 [Flavobacterium sp.]|nr:MAG: hypothetical protein EOO47_00020 [Flavobacterium sp.]
MKIPYLSGLRVSGQVELKNLTELSSATKYLTIDANNNVHWSVGASGSGNVDLSNYFTKGQSDLRFYPLNSNPNDYLTSVDWSIIGNKPSFFSGAYGDLTGRPTLLSQFSNDVGYITGFTETDTLDSVLGRGNTSNKNINVSGKATFNGQLIIPSSTSVDNNSIWIGNANSTGNTTPVIGFLNDLQDVTITSAFNGQALVYNGSQWVNQTVVTSLGDYYTKAQSDGKYALIGSIPTNVSQLINDSGYVTSSIINGYATQVYVNNSIANLVASAPSTLDTLNELATALGNDPNFATTITNLIGTKVNTSSLGSNAYESKTHLSQYVNDLGNYGGWITAAQGSGIFQPLENQRLSSGNNVVFNKVTASNELIVPSTSSTANQSIWIGSANSTGNTSPTVTTLASLQDVNFSNLINGQSIAYNSTTGKWYNTSYAAAGNYANADGSNINVSSFRNYLGLGSLAYQNKVDRLYSPTNPDYYIRHDWNGLGWNLRGENDANDTQANIHLVNINGTAEKANLWNEYDGAGLVSGTYQYIMGYDATAGKWRPSNAGQVQAYLGINLGNNFHQYHSTFGVDANTVEPNTSSFTYAVNAPYVGALTYFGSNYGMQLNSNYGSGGHRLAYRTRDGDVNFWNPWRNLIVEDNYVTNWAINIAGNAYSATYWGAGQADFSASTNDTPTYIVGYTSGVAKPHNAIGIQAFLGLGSFAYRNSINGNEVGTGTSNAGADIGVAQMLRWKNYGNNHVIFDASNATAPNGASVDRNNPTVPWSINSSLPTLMGWNGGDTFGVRVDSARLADNSNLWNGKGLIDTQLDTGYSSGMGGIYIKLNGNPNMYPMSASGVREYLNIIPETLQSVRNRGRYIYSTTNATTSFSEAAFEVRETNMGGTGSFLPPRMAFHWGGVVASQIGLESNGRIAILNNPGSDYESLIALNIRATGEVRANSWFYSEGNTGWFNETHTGGIYMSDSTWVRVYNGKGFLAENTIQAPDFIATGNGYAVSNYGIGLVGAYDATRYQNIFSMGAAYKPTVDGTSLSNMYGIAWTHTNVGGQSKAGLSHQALFVTAGQTQTAIGTGIWTIGKMKSEVEVEAPVVKATAKMVLPTSAPLSPENGCVWIA